MEKCEKFRKLMACFVVHFVFNKKHMFYVHIIALDTSSFKICWYVILNLTTYWVKMWNSVDFLDSDEKCKNVRATQKTCVNNVNNVLILGILFNQKNYTIQN